MVKDIIFKNKVLNLEQFTVDELIEYRQFAIDSYVEPIFLLASIVERSLELGTKPQLVQYIINLAPQLYDTVYDNNFFGYFNEYVHILTFYPYKGISNEQKTSFMNLAVSYFNNISSDTVIRWFQIEVLIQILELLSYNNQNYYDGVISDLLESIIPYMEEHDAYEYRKRRDTQHYI